MAAPHAIDCDALCILTSESALTVSAMWTTGVCLWDWTARASLRSLHAFVSFGRSWSSPSPNPSIHQGIMFVPSLQFGLEVGLHLCCWPSIKPPVGLHNAAIESLCDIKLKEMDNINPFYNIYLKIHFWSIGEVFFLKHMDLLMMILICCGSLLMAYTFIYCYYDKM